MKKLFSLFLGVVAGICIAQGVFAADSGYPKLLGAAEIQKLYGEKDASIEFSGPRGRMNIRVHGDTLFGRNLDAFNTLGPTSSTGVWKVDASANKVCHQWANKQWKDTCFYVRQTGADNYEYALSPDGVGTPFKINY